MSIKGFILGGLVGFGIGVYHGHNYATEQYKKDLKYTKITYELPISTREKSPLEKMIKEKAIYFKYSKNQL